MQTRYAPIYGHQTTTMRANNTPPPLLGLLEKHLSQVVIYPSHRAKPEERLAMMDGDVLSLRNSDHSRSGNVLSFMNKKSIQYQLKNLLEVGLGGGRAGERVGGVFKYFISYMLVETVELRIPKKQAGEKGGGGGLGPGGFCMGFRSQIRHFS